MKLHAPLERIFGRAVLSDAHVVGGDALDAAVLVEQDLGGGKAWVDLNAQLLGLLAEPLHEMAETDDVVAVVVHGHALQDRHRDSAALRQDGKLVGRDWSLQRSAALLPVWD